MDRLDTTRWETERQDGDDTCVQLDDIPGTHNWWCATAPQARGLAEQHAASLGPTWTVDHDARPRPHYPVVQVVGTRSPGESAGGACATAGTTSTAAAGPTGAGPAGSWRRPSWRRAAAEPVPVT